MKTPTKIILGVILVAVGLVVGLNAAGITNIDIFFDGWWTLFIIVPCFIGLFKESGKLGNLIGIAIGLFLLACCQDLIDYELFWKLLIPAIIVLVGLNLIFGGLFGKKVSKKANKIFHELRNEGKNAKIGCATFSAVDMSFDGEVFEGAELTAAFGSVKCDLRGAIIEKDAAISVSATFGGIDILLPQGVNVKVSSNSIFGAISNKCGKSKAPDAPTLYVSGCCMFGGVEIK